MTESVVSAIQPKLLQTEIDLAARRPNDLSAYDLCLRALRTSIHGPGADRPRPFGLPLAHWRLTLGTALLRPLQGSCHLRNVRQGWAADPKSEIAEGLRLLRLALSIDGNDHVSIEHAWLRNGFLVWRFRYCKGDGGPCGRPKP